MASTEIATSVDYAWTETENLSYRVTAECTQETTTWTFEYGRKVNDEICGLLQRGIVAEHIISCGGHGVPRIFKIES